MENSSSIFNKWVPEKLKVPLLTFAVFPHLMLLRIFNLNTTFTASFLDMDVDDLQFMFGTPYATLICGLFINGRFFEAFNIRSYLLLMTMLNIVVLFAISLTTNQELLVLLRLIQGPLIVFEGTIIIPILMSCLKTRHARLIANSILYAYMLTNDKLTTYIVKFAIDYYNHNTVLYAIMGFHMLLLPIFLFLFNNNRMFAKKPLYQLNLGGIALIAIAMVSGVFFLVYGKKHNWFESEMIMLSFVTSIVFCGLFILHQKTTRRPIFHFEIFRSERVILGMLMFFAYAVIRSSLSNVFQVMLSVWKWHWEYVLDIQYINVFSCLAGLLVAFILIIKNISYRAIFAVGFFILACSLLWFSFVFYPDTTLLEIGIPIALDGFAQGFLFTPIVFYMIGSVNPSIIGSTSQIGTAVRYLSGIVGYSIMQNSLLYLTNKNQLALTKNLDVSNPIFQTHWEELFSKFSATHLSNEATELAAKSIHGQLYNQALLLSNIEIFTALFVVTILIFISIVVYAPLKSIILKTYKKSNLHI